MELVKPTDNVFGKSKPIQNFPKEVFESANELIVKHWDGRRARFKLSELANLVVKKMNHGVQIELNLINRSYLYNNHFLDIEEHYRNQGWKVYFDKSAYYETYESTFTFTKKKD